MFDPLAALSVRRRSPELHHDLRIVTWNCRGALHRKFGDLAALQPDVAVIQECATPDKWRHPGASDALWAGGNRSKGPAVIAFGEYRLEAAPLMPEGGEIMLPVRVSGPMSPESRSSSPLCGSPRITAA